MLYFIVIYYALEVPLIETPSILGHHLLGICETRCQNLQVSFRLMLDLVEKMHHDWWASHLPKPRQCRGKDGPFERSCGVASKGTGSQRTYFGTRPSRDFTGRLVVFFWPLFFKSLFVCDIVIIILFVNMKERYCMSWVIPIILDSQQALGFIWSKFFPWHAPSPHHLFQCCLYGKLSCTVVENSFCPCPSKNHL